MWFFISTISIKLHIIKKYLNKNLSITLHMFKITRRNKYSNIAVECMLYACM